MKTLKEITPLLLTLSLVFTGFRCGEDIEPAKTILGKWEITRTNLGAVTPSGYEEYLQDSILISYSYIDNTSFYQKYWFSDSLLVKSFVFIDQYDNDTIVFKFLYRFKFVNYNEFHLEARDPSIQNYFIYKRIK
ncbi:MAG: hypothetical protein KF845_07300 [Cyclobacteriaceae bacterium]|nr:hypothetical protein [Cyclobacteriaceae bacterium]